MKNNIAAILMVIAICAPGARAFAVASQEPFAASVGAVLAQANSSSGAQRENAGKEQVVRDISRVTDLYTNGVSPITRCMGERNIPAYHWNVGALAILGMRIQQGRYAGASGDKAISKELQHPAGMLLRFAQTDCLLFTDSKTRAAWVDALEALLESK